MHRLPKLTPTYDDIGHLPMLSLLHILWHFFWWVRHYNTYVFWTIPGFIGTLCTFIMFTLFIIILHFRIDVFRFMLVFALYIDMGPIVALSMCGKPRYILWKKKLVSHSFWKKLILSQVSLKNNTLNQVITAKNIPYWQKLYRCILH